MESAASALEKLAAPGSPLGPLLTGRWLLLYTTSESILGLRARRSSGRLGPSSRRLVGLSDVQCMHPLE